MRKDIRNDLIIRKSKDETLLPKLKLAKKEINNFISSEKGKALLDEEYHIDHILLPVVESLNPELKSKEKKN